MMERKWVVCAFGDIRGFGTWTSRAASSREVKDPYIEGFYALMDEYVMLHRDIYFKRVGDGFMALKEFTLPDPIGIKDFLITLRWITRKAIRGIGDCRYPRPAGFRIRIMCGDVYKIPVIDANDPERKRLIYEYVEYPTNGGAHMLEVNPEIPALASEGVVDEMGEAGKIFRVRDLKEPSCFPSSVNIQDVKGLKILSF